MTGESSLFSRRPSSPRDREFVATCTRGVEAALAEELRELVEPIAIQERRGAVAFRGSLRHGYRACLWSRLASRVLIVLDRIDVPDTEALYEGVRSIPWLDHLRPGCTIAVDFVGTSEAIRNSRFGAQKTKDAIVDRIRSQHGGRPDVDLDSPDIRINVHTHDGRATVSIDLAGEALHRRGHGRVGREAPLKENLAAAMLRLADWPALARQGAPLLDPMCGSGTLVIEGAGMALDRAPNLARRRWGFAMWRPHEPRTWQRLLDEAVERARAAEGRPIAIFGADINSAAVRTAEANADVAGVPVRLTVRPIRDLEPPPAERADSPRGLLITNPPFGQRLGDEAEAEALHNELGDVLRRRFLGWNAHVLAGSKRLAGSVGLKPSARIPIFNGPIECRLMKYEISTRPVEGRGPGWRDGGDQPE